MTSIPPFQPATLDDISSRLTTLTTTYRSNRTKPLSFRLSQLRKLYWSIVDNQQLIIDALYADLHKCSYEAILDEVNWCKSAVLDYVNHAEEWLADEPLKGLTWTNRPLGHHLRNVPMGKILIISAYNFPFQISIPPLAAAIAGGNCVVVKPSEGSPASAMVIEKIMREALDPECYTCINGGVTETKALLDEKWAKIAFVGGKKVGDIVARKAAETLTPVLLELGGRNPAFITQNANVALAARRLMFHKTMNAGQVCFSHNYILVERPCLSTLIAEINKQARIMFPKGAKDSPDYGRIVNKVQFNRIKAMLDNTKGKIVLGGATDESDLFIEPTVVLCDDIEDSMIVEESFGPVWSIMAVDSLDEAIDIANKVDPTPLSCFTFGSDEENEKVLMNIHSGSANINDCSAHGQVVCSPNGGFGTSGTGRVGGYYSLREFTHQKTVTKVPNWVESLIRVRYMPYEFPLLRRHERMTQGKPNFDRDGNVIKGVGYWLSLVLGLGAKSFTGFVTRWATLLVVAAATAFKTGHLQEMLA